MSSKQQLHYPKLTLPRLRYQFCPMCQTQLVQSIIADDNIPRPTCPSCKWVHYPANAQGVNVIIRLGEEIVALLPPGEPADAPAALPSGHIEYGESPEEAAIREAREETGLEVEIIRCLGWYFEANTSYPGPIISFIFETKAIGGHLSASEEGQVQTFALNSFPPISPNRGGSKRAFDIFVASLGSS